MSLYPYITKDNLIGLGYDLTNISDDDITAICNRASMIADNYCMQTLGEVEETEQQSKALFQNGYLKVFPHFLPLGSVSSVKLYYSLDSYVSYSKFKIFSAQGYFLADLGVSNSIGYVNPYQEIAFVEYTYTHGYATVPDDAIQAIVLIAGNLISDYNTRVSTNFEGVSSLKDGQRQINFASVNATPFNIADNCPNSAKKILDSYRAIRY